MRIGKFKRVLFFNNVVIRGKNRYLATTPKRNIIGQRETKIERKRT
ncbi:MAG: hypothetical protein DDT32_01407 [Syntrophomonadaceae bacterium]|nr:hypothetical protein [Bacillota bacterium]